MFNLPNLPPLPSNSKYFLDIPEIGFKGFMQPGGEYYVDLYYPGHYWRYIIAAVAIEEWHNEECQERNSEKHSGPNASDDCVGYPSVLKAMEAQKAWREWKDKKEN